MAFNVLVEDDVERYLLAFSALTRSERRTVLDGVVAELGRSADRFLRDFPRPGPRYPLGFDYSFVILSQRLVLHHFGFSCNGGGHACGVTEVLYVDSRSLAGVLDDPSVDD